MTTFVVVPGAWLGGWAWNKVVPLLEQEGHETRAVTLTEMGERVHLASEDVGIETAVQDVLNVSSTTTSMISCWWGTVLRER